MLDPIGDTPILNPLKTRYIHRSLTSYKRSACVTGSDAGLAVSGNTATWYMQYTSSLKLRYVVIDSRGTSSWVAIAPNFNIWRLDIYHSSPQVLLKWEALGPVHFGCQIISHRSVNALFLSHLITGIAGALYQNVV